MAPPLHFHVALRFAGYDVPLSRGAPGGPFAHYFLGSVRGRRLTKAHRRTISSEAVSKLHFHVMRLASSGFCGGLKGWLRRHLLIIP